MEAFELTRLRGSQDIYFRKFRVSTSVADRRWKYVTQRARPMAVSQAATVVMVMDVRMPCKVHRVERNL